MNKYKEKFKILKDIKEFQAISDFFSCGIMKIGIREFWWIYKMFKILRLFNSQIRSYLERIKTVTGGVGLLRSFKV
ncbi:MAG TPA: hypothetical protein GXX15_09780 [Clostridia bacterium]|nr:hypothetical protein [Clostridia bacterium]